MGFLTVEQPDDYLKVINEQLDKIIELLKIMVGEE